jgi:hypothetical protein
LSVNPKSFENRSNLVRTDMINPELQERGK